MISFIIVVVIALGVFIYAIHLASKNPELYKEAKVQTEDLMFTMRMKETSYGIGEPISLRLEVRNISSEPQKLSFAESLESDFLVQKEVNLVFARLPMSVWRYSASIGSKPDHHVVLLQPQEVKVYTATWDQKDFNGRQVKPGNYIITGNINLVGQNTELQLRGSMKKNK